MILDPRRFKDFGLINKCICFANICQQISNIREIQWYFVTFENDHVFSSNLKSSHVTWRHWSIKVLSLMGGSLFCTFFKKVAQNASKRGSKVGPAGGLYWGCADRDFGFLWNSMNVMVCFDGVRFLVSPKRYRKWRDLEEYFSKTYTFFSRRHLWKKLQAVEEGSKSRKFGEIVCWSWFRTRIIDSKPKHVQINYTQCVI